MNHKKTICEAMETRQNDMDVKKEVRKDYEEINTVADALSKYAKLPNNEAAVFAFYFGTFVALTSPNFRELRLAALHRDALAQEDKETLKGGAPDGAVTH